MIRIIMNWCQCYDNNDTKILLKRDKMIILILFIMLIASIGAGDRANQAVTTPEAGEWPDQILKKILNPKYISKI